jgi:multidrug efflux pump subunit AcrB
MKQFGLVMVISIVLSFLAAVLMMPLLIRFWHREDLAFMQAEVAMEAE